MGTGASKNSVKSTVNTAVTATRWKTKAHTATSNLAPSEDTGHNDIKAAEARYVGLHFIQ